MPARLAWAQLFAAFGLLVFGKLLVELLVEPLMEPWLGKRLIYFHVVSTGAVSLGVVAAVLLLSRQSAASVGLAGATRAELGWGLLAIFPAYMANILVSVTYMLLTRRDLLNVVGDKADAMEILAGIELSGVLPVAVYVGIHEEILFRGFLLSRLWAGLAADRVPAGRVAAVVIAAAAFGVLHGYQGTLGMIQTFTLGIVFCVISLFRRGIWACMVAHIGIDTFGLLMLHLVLPTFRELMQAATQPAS